MSKDISGIPAKFLLPLNMNKLRGRMLYLPAQSNKTRDILLIYDIRSDIEKYYGLAKQLHKYGAVTIPDLPGFGGMESFYKINEKPDLDKLAGYLATFVRWRFKRRRLTIMGHGFGFAVVTRMLQKYPDISKNVDLLISLVGYAHKDDIMLPKLKLAPSKFSYFMLAHQPTAAAGRIVLLNRYTLRPIYSHKYKSLKPEQKSALVKQQIKLWHKNDTRTWARAKREEMSLDNCNYTVDLPLWHIWVARNQGLRNNMVYQHLKVIYADVHRVKLGHQPDLMQGNGQLIPAQIKSQLRKANT